MIHIQAPESDVGQVATTLDSADGTERGQRRGSSGAQESKLPWNLATVLCSAPAVYRASLGFGFLSKSE